MYVFRENLETRRWSFFFTFRADGTVSLTTVKGTCWGKFSYNNGLFHIQLEGRHPMILFVDERLVVVKCNNTVLQGRFFLVNEAPVVFGRTSIGHNFGLIEPTKEFSTERVKFNIGGKTVQFLREDLDQFPECLFSRLLNIKGMKIDKDNEGAIIIGKEVPQVYLNYIVKFVQDGETPVTQEFCQQVESEALFFGLSQFSIAIKRIRKDKLQFGGRHNLEKY